MTTTSKPVTLGSIIKQICETAEKFDSETLREWADDLESYALRDRELRDGLERLRGECKHYAELELPPPQSPNFIVTMAGLGINCGAQATYKKLHEKLTALLGKE